MSRQFAVVYTDDALADLVGIGEYITEELREPQVARRLIGKIRDASKTLASMPRRHPLADWKPWSEEGVRRMSVGNHSVFYVVSDEQRSVTVLRILYSRMDVRGRYGDESDS